MNRVIDNIFIILKRASKKVADKSEDKIKFSSNVKLKAYSIEGCLYQWRTNG